MTPARALRLLLAVALLAAWQGALLHPLEHLDSRGALVHGPGGSPPEHDGESGADVSCQVLAALAACIPDGLPARSGAATEREAVAAFESSPPGATPPPYRSQAPPSRS